MRAVGVIALFLAGLFGAVGVGSAAGTDTTTTDTTTTVVTTAPTIRSVTADTNGITILWNAPATNGGPKLTGFKLYRSAGTNSPTLLATLGLVDSYTDGNVTPGTTYTYQVSALFGTTESPLSAPASATAVGSAPASLFAPYQAYRVGSWPDAVAIGDVSGDGRNDVVMTTSYYFDPANDFHLWVFLQAADGTLSPPVSYATAAGYSTGPDSVAIGDITGDGRADVVLGVDGVGVQVFPQLVSGGLGSPTMYASGDTNKIRLGQLNADGLLDVAGVGWGTNTVGVLLNDGHGGLSAPVTYPALHGGYDDLEVADVTGDGRDDIVVMSGQLYADPNVSILPQLPGGGFATAAPYTVQSNTNTQGIGVGDVTGDGLNDVVASYGGNRPNSFVAVLGQTATAGLAPPVSYPSYDIPEPVEVADVDLDGRPDVVTLHGGWSEAGVYLQRSDGTLGTEQLFPIPYASHYNPHGLAVGDVNGDGAPDIVLADYNNGLVVLRNTTVAPSAPAAPVLASAVAGAGGISLTWTQPSGGDAPTGYRVYRGTGGGSMAFVAAVGAANRSYTDTSVAGGTTYSYAVTAVNAAGESAASNQLSATAWTVPGPPTLTAAKGGKGGVALTWRPPAANGGAAVTGYRIYRGAASGAETLLATVGDVTSYADTSAPNGKTSYYQVAAVNAMGAGARSNELSAKRTG